MAPLIRYDRAKQRVWIMGLRLHHGAVGFGLTFIGVVLCHHDRKDFPWYKDLP